MNIFVLDEDPQQAARMMCDKHIPKMIVETFQMMGSALRRHGATDEQMPLTSKGKPLIGGYKNHPCTRWAGDCRSNFAWLALHGMALCTEYQWRFVGCLGNEYTKKHSCHDGITQMANMWDMIPNTFTRMTPYVQAMPDEYKMVDAVDAYRQYYIMEKAYFAKWEKGRPAPYWWTHKQEECNA
jgi:hypothetical protein